VTMKATGKSFYEFGVSEMTDKQVLTSLTIDGYHKYLFEYVMRLGKNTW
jgi:hypothetical protein